MILSSCPCTCEASIGFFSPINVLSLALYGIQVLQIDHEEVALLATTGFLSAIQWIIWLFIPLIQVQNIH